MTLILNDSLYSKVANFVAVLADGHIIIETVQGSCDDIVAPAFIPYKNEQFVTSGLCNVTRHVVKHAIKIEENDDKKKEKRLLLGYKENCLKGCAAISNWTKFCEKDFPEAAEKLMQDVGNLSSQIVMPEEFIRLEKEFIVPKKTANAMKHRPAGRENNIHLNSDNTVDIYKMNRILTKIKLLKPTTCNTLLYESCQKSIPVINDIKNTIKNKEIFWPYLCGFDVTIADLLVLAVLVELITKMPCFCMIKDFFIALPNTCNWFFQCVSKSSITDAILKVWNVNMKQRCSNLKSPIFTFNIDPETVNHVAHVEKYFNTKQMHSRITKHLPTILMDLSDHNIFPKFCTDKVTSIMWSELPAEVNPTEGELNAPRALRKRQQIENMVSLILPLLKSGDKIVDFCAGGGHLGIVIAFMKPDCHITLLENKEESIDRAIGRIKKLGLTNISLRLSNLEYFVGKFDIGIALHACGSATDLVLQKCVACMASFVICPCCYGSIKPSNSITYPRSKMFSFLNEMDYLILGHSADQTSSDFDTDYSKQGKASMLYVDYDRTLQAEDMHGYETSIYSMVPQSCSPKNNVIVGIIGRYKSNVSN